MPRYLLLQSEPVTATALQHLAISVKITSATPLVNERYWNREANFRLSAVEQSGCHLMAFDRYYRTSIPGWSRCTFGQFEFWFLKLSTAQATVSKMTLVFTNTNPADPGAISLVGTHITQWAGGPQARDLGLANSNGCWLQRGRAKQKDC